MPLLDNYPTKRKQTPSGVDAALAIHPYHHACQEKQVDDADQHQPTR